MYKEVKKSLKAAGGTAKWRELCEVLYDSATCISLSLLLRNDDDKEVPLLGRPHTPPAAAEAGAEAATEAATEAAAAEAAAAEAATTDAVEVAAEAKAAEAAEAEAVKAAAEAEAAEEAFYGGEGAAAHAGGGTGILGSTPSLLAHSLPSTEITLTSLQREERERHSRYAAALSGPASSGGIPPPCAFASVCSHLRPYSCAAAESAFVAAAAAFVVAASTPLCTCGWGRQQRWKTVYHGLPTCSEHRCDDKHSDKRACDGRKQFDRQWSHQQ